MDVYGTYNELVTRVYNNELVTRVYNNELVTRDYKPTFTSRLGGPHCRYSYGHEKVVIFMGLYYTW